MSFAVRELPKARADKEHIFDWLHEHAPDGARAWLDAYDACLERLEYSAASYGPASENASLQLEVRQVFFRTKRGRAYRVLFYMEEQDVYILRVIGLGQAPVDATEL